MVEPIEMSFIDKQNLTVEAAKSLESMELQGFLSLTDKINCLGAFKYRLYKMDMTWKDISGITEIYHEGIKIMKGSYDQKFININPNTSEFSLNSKIKIIEAITLIKDFTLVFGKYAMNFEDLKRELLL